MSSSRGVTTAHRWVQLPDERLACYLAWDLVSTARLKDPLVAELKRHGQWDYFTTEWWPTVPSVLAMQRRGLPVDLGEKRRLRGEFRREAGECEQLVAAEVKLVGDRKVTGLNVNSDTQVRRWLFGADKHTRTRGEVVALGQGLQAECMGLRPAGKTDGGAWSVDKDNLVRVLRDLRKMDEHARPVLENLLHRSRLVKLDEYLDFDTERGVDGVHRVFPVVKMTGTKTLRFAYADPPIHSWADEIRSVVCAPEGRVFVAGDWSALEARIFSILTGDEHDLAVFDDPSRDIHVETALAMFGLPEIPGEKRKAYRNTAKTFRYGVLQYGGEPETLKAKTYCPCPRCRERLPDTLSLSREELRKVTDRFFARHPNVRKWRAEVVAQVRRTRSYVAPSGLRRFYLAPMGEELWKEAWNWPIQHLAAWLAHRAQRRLHERYEAPVVLQHHDSLVLEVPEWEGEVWATRLKGVMEDPVPELWGRVFPVDIKRGKRWSDL